MSGIEPESERFFPRMSTSVAGGLVSLVAPLPAQAGHAQGAGTRRPLFHTLNTIRRVALPLCDARIHLRQEFGVGGRGLSVGDQLRRYSLRQRGALQRSLCDWHLLFCTDLSSSAPLGSQFGACLSRRDLSSPCTLIIPQPPITLGFSYIKFMLYCQSNFFLNLGFY